MILIVDNYDSFTYNLLDYFNQLGEECDVVRNSVPPENIEQDKYSALVLSPGSGRPEEAGFLLEYIRVFEQIKPILGICLGHQAIAKYYGADIVKAKRPMHGKISNIEILHEDELFKGMKMQFDVVRYHSLVIKSLENTVLQALANTLEGENMIIKHRFLPIYGIQYHPEAALTRYGLEILSNWMHLVDLKNETASNKP